MKQAALALLIQDGLVLGVSRKDTAELFGLPGGKVEIGESLEEAAKLELFEETGFVAESLNRVFVRVDHDFSCTTFLVEKFKKQEDSQESGLVNWVTWQTLFDGPFGKYNKELYKEVFCTESL